MPFISVYVTDENMKKFIIRSDTFQKPENAGKFLEHFMEIITKDNPKGTWNFLESLKEAFFDNFAEEDYPKSPSEVIEAILTEYDT